MAFIPYQQQELAYFFISSLLKQKLEAARPIHLDGFLGASTRGSFFRPTKAVSSSEVEEATLAG